MKMYIKLAFSNIIKNRRLYVPHMCTGAGLMAVFYIMLTLSFDERLKSVKGGNYLPTIMGMGVIIVGLVSVILMLYTNSFLMKRRQSEFGLYNVLGMEKRHIGRILFCETLIAGITALLVGLVFGIVLYKLCALLICRILKVDSVLGFYHVSLKIAGLSIFIFVCIYGAIYLFNLVRIAAMKPMKLLASSHEGEREPKTKWLMAILGFVSLAAGYYIAITTKSPLKALYLFFLAVILVIVGTYFLFMAGSIVILKALRRNKKFYYRSRNMITVSGMLYRMKQNAAGLASISILATCVLVMMSSTVTLYASIEDSLKKQFPHPLNITLDYSTMDPQLQKEFEPKLKMIDGAVMTAEDWEIYDNAKGRMDIPEEIIMNALKKAAGENDLQISDAFFRQYLTVAYAFDGHSMTAQDNIELYDGICQCFYVTLENYNAITGSHASLGKNEILVAELKGNSQHIAAGASVDITGIDLKVKEKLNSFIVPMEDHALADCYGIVVADDEVFDLINKKQCEAYGRYSSNIDRTVMVDFEDEELAEKKFEETRFVNMYDSLREEINAYAEAQENNAGGYVRCSTIWDTKSEAYGLLGTLMFLGILL
ncbi:MAG: ABC transporter permease, partial [Lachnospiraceae bacterium]|nr:ABC transporter permease [Lachnospiraceae bacterium]